MKKAACMSRFFLYTSYMAPALTSSVETFGLTLVDRVLGHEGGYSNNPADRGGETNWGVTEATARRFGYTQPMRIMTRPQAVEIYMQLFWRNRFSLIASQGMQSLAYTCLDFGVNSGPGRPAEALQRALNALNGRQKRWEDVVVDGDIGHKTLTALTHAAFTLPDAEVLLSFVVNSLRVAFVMNLAERDERQETFMLGWLRRYQLVATTKEATPHA
jgi:lysozyme family protein